MTRGGWILRPELRVMKQVPATTGEVQGNLERVRERIARAAERSGRNASDVILIAVTKTVPIERIRQAVEAGVTHLGENRVQDARAKFGPHGTPLARSIADTNHVPRSTFHATLHMIGSLQRNKAREAA